MANAGGIDSVLDGAARLPGEADPGERMKQQGLRVCLWVHELARAEMLRDWLFLLDGASTNDSVCPEGSAVSFPPGLGC